ncbi:AAA family ATPase [Solihabitans fulvus]|uniref:AAA family ATPase n=1 Tax=Solihabitans fulvus TaxID=1892852 RepID=UPI001661FA0D|nr:LuxR family transcriptional regulator [Solihabitans fulvus]
MTRALSGRAAQVRVLTDAVGTLADSRTGQVIVLSGGVGIGKTTLLRHARDLAHAKGVRVLEANASALEHEYAFGVARQLVAAVGVAIPQVRAEAPFEAMHALFGQIEQVTSGGPALLIVDDLQWADAASLRFLNYLAARIATHPITVLAGRRPDAVSAGNAPLIDQLLARADQLWVAPFEPAELAELAERTFDEAADEAFALACHSASGGNPFLAVELLGHLREHGVRPTGEAAAQVAMVTPQTTIDCLAGRLEGIDGGLALARALAVIGEDGGPELAAELAGLDMAGAASTLEALLKARLVVEDAGSIVFVSSMVASAAAATLNSLAALRWHARAAELCHRQFRSTEQIAAHLLQAGTPAQDWQISILTEAAEAAYGVGAFESAGTLFRHALGSPQLTSDERLRLRARVAAALVFGDPVAAHRELAELLPLTSGDLHAQVASDLLLVTLSTRGFSAGTAFLDTVIDQVVDHDPAAALPLISRSLGIGWLSDSPVRRVLDVVDAVADERKYGRAILAAARAQLAGEIATDADACAEQAVLALELLWGNGEPDASEMSIHMGAIQGLLCSERFEVALAWIAKGEDLAQRRGWTTVLPFAAWARFVCLSVSGHTDATLAAAIAVRTTTATVFDDNDPLDMSGGFIACAFLLAGRMAEAEEALGPFASGEITRPNQFYTASTRAGLRLLQRRFGQAHGDALMCARLMPDTSVNPLIAHWRSIGALAANGMGDPTEASRLAEEELRLARAWGTPHTLGTALAAAGTVRQDRALLREAVEVTRGTHARLALVAALLALDEVDGLVEALEVAEQYGLGLFVPAIREALRAHGRRPGVKAVTGANALTSSEQSVADLAAAGLTNAAICGRLHLAPRTVEQHLTHAYRKLKIAGRKELAAALRG